MTLGKIGGVPKKIFPERAAPRKCCKYTVCGLNKEWTLVFFCCSFVHSYKCSFVYSYKYQLFNFLLDFKAAFTKFARIRVHEFLGFRCFSRVSNAFQQKYNFDQVSNAFHKVKILFLHSVNG